MLLHVYALLRAWCTYEKLDLQDAEHTSAFIESLCLHVTQGCNAAGNSFTLLQQMANWYPGVQQMLHQHQQQPGQHPDIAYAAVPQPVCLAPPLYPQVSYAYNGMPLTATTMQHVWVPIKVNSDLAPYPYCYGHMQAQHSLNFRQQMPYREVRRPASARSSNELDPLQMAWPDSPMTAQSSHLTRQRTTEWAPPRQQISRPPTSNHSVTPPHTPFPVDSCQRSQLLHSATNKQLAHLSLNDDTNSTYSTAFAGRSDASVSSSASPADALASSEAAGSSEPPIRTTTTGQAQDCTQAAGATAAAAEHVEDGVVPAWQWLTVGLLRDVMSELPKHCRKRCRLICKRWRATMDVSVQVQLLACSTSHWPTPWSTPWTSGGVHDGFQAMLLCMFV